MSHPYLKPCPTCHRVRCGWHEPRGRCDGVVEVVEVVAWETLVEAPKRRPLWLRPDFWGGVAFGSFAAMAGMLLRGWM